MRDCSWYINGHVIKLWTWSRNVSCFCDSVNVADTLAVCTNGDKRALAHICTEHVKSLITRRFGIILSRACWTFSLVVEVDGFPALPRALDSFVPFLNFSTHSHQLLRASALWLYCAKILHWIPTPDTYYSQWNWMTDFCSCVLPIVCRRGHSYIVTAARKRARSRSKFYYVTTIVLGRRTY